MNHIEIKKCALCGKDISKIKDTFFEVYVHHRGKYKGHHSICSECIPNCGDLVRLGFNFLS